MEPDQQTPTPTVVQVEEPTTETVQVQDLTVTHDRQVTASHGVHTVGRWAYPARVYDGRTQYQNKDGDWVDATE